MTTQHGRVGIVMVVHGWGARCDAAVGRIVDDDDGSTLVVVQNQVSAFGASRAACRRVGTRLLTTPDPSFAAANRLGAEALVAECEWLLFTQSDVTFGASAIEQAVALASRGASVVGPSGGVLSRCADGFAIHERGHNPGVDDVPTQPVQVSFVTGYWMLMRTTDYVRSGGWDPGYGLYWEDVDLCMRLFDVGVGSIVDPSLDVEHERGQTIARERGCSAREILRSFSRDRFERRWAGRWTDGLGKHW